MALNPSKVEEFDINKVQILIGLQRNPKRELDSCESRCSWLQFLQDIPPVVYTGENIIVKGTSLDIALVDAATGDVVKYGPEASAKVEIVVLNGDVYPDSGIWTADQLSDHIVWGKERNVILRKDLYVNLQGGIGCISEIKLKQDRDWTSINKVRLGARVVDLPDSIKVREAMTGLFIVRDKRSKSKKREQPSPTDEVWRLKKIAKGGPFHERLNANDIRTVGDFLTEFSKNAARLRGILGPRMYDHMWDVTLTHAQGCKMDERKFLNSPSEKCQEIAMINRCGSFTDMTSNQHRPEDFLQKFNEFVSSDAIIFEDSKQVPYAYQQSTSNDLMQTCLQDNDFLDSINELLLTDELHGNKIMNSSNPEAKKPPLNSKGCPQFVIPGNICCVYSSTESYADPQREVNDFLFPPDANAFKGNGNGKKSWTLFFCIVKWFLIRRIVKIENRIGKRPRFC